MHDVLCVNLRELEMCVSVCVHMCVCVRRGVCVLLLAARRWVAHVWKSWACLCARIAPTSCFMKMLPPTCIGVWARIQSCGLGIS